MSELAIATVTHNELHNKLPRLVYSVMKFIPYGVYMVWDNASDDGTEFWLRSVPVPRLRVLRSEVNLYDLPAYNRLANAVQVLGYKHLLFINPNTRILGRIDVEALLKPFREDEKLVILGRPGPRVPKEKTIPEGMEDWRWCAQLLEERDFWEPEDTDTAHVQTFCFVVDVDKFIELGGFRFRNKLFDVREPEKRFPERSFDYTDKGNMIASEIEFSVRARRLGYHIGYALPWPFYHYFSYRGSPHSIEEMDEIDAKRGFPPLGYKYGQLGEDIYGRRKSVTDRV